MQRKLWLEKQLKRKQPRNLQHFLEKKIHPQVRRKKKEKKVLKKLKKTTMTMKKVKTRTTKCHLKKQSP